ncbi:uncharacterized protein B0T23DRAFT_394284 [Neurospora hispaniola]|uniref:Uncharacterized protein n=1 Tax=Neurospora hispaniola TaxID=588809 RepID=A0AAJ0I918_9PEZI|nr:hypothetical protein B0T23DRAFT_394284 [Neurospora hispaniola]
MTAQNKMQNPNPRSYSQSDPSRTQGEVHELESPPPSYEAAVLGTNDRSQGRQIQSHNVNEPTGEVHFLNQQERLREQPEQQQQQRELQRQQRDLQRQQLAQQLEQQRQQREQQRQQLEQQLEQQRQQRELQRQLQQQQQQQPYPIQEYSSSNHDYQPDAKHPNTSQQDGYDVEAQQPTVASSSVIRTPSSGQVQTDPRDRRGHGRGGCQHENGKQRSGKCCVACFGNGRREAK